MKNEQNNPIEKIGLLIKRSVTLKIVTITILMLMLLIPTSMIQSVIQEREMLNEQAIEEVSSKWAKSQQLQGPILSIPLLYEYINKEEVVEVTKYWHFLPEDLNIDSKVVPRKLKRGIYDVVVYESVMDIDGNFMLNEEPDIENLKEIQFQNAFITIGISDLRGIKNDIPFRWNNDILEVNPGSRITEGIYSGVTIDLPPIDTEISKQYNFKFNLELDGSRNISFTPVGASTKVKIQSPWNSPSFNGGFLPSKRNITEEGFTAEWSVLQLNRNFPQTWTGNKYFESIGSSEFGVDLILPLDDYQKSYRSVKYSAMTIALTFLIFFLVEILNKRKIHPLQYSMVGLALCLFYTLLVSLSEHIDFNIAFGVSSLSIVVMISLYSLSIFKSKKLSLLLVFVLSGIYSFLFVTLQMIEFALLMGSIGLTLILAATMYFTRKVNWYKVNIQTE